MLEMQPSAVVDCAHRMGIKSNIPPYASIALGSAEVTPLELTSAYGVFPNEGVLVDPIAILRIEDKDGNVIEEDVPEKREVLSKETAYLMTNLMEGGVNEEGGTGVSVRRYFSLPAAGKTGTTNDYGDAWFEGFTPHLAAGIWVGFDDNRIKFGSADGQGGRAAAPIFGRFMRDTYEDPDIGLQLDYFRQPDGIITDTICVLTKKKATPFCPQDTTEIFNVKYPLLPAMSTQALTGAKRRAEIRSTGEGIVFDFEVSVHREAPGITQNRTSSSPIDTFVPSMPAAPCLLTTTILIKPADCSTNSRWKTR